KYVEDLFTNIDGKIIESSSGVYKGVADGEYLVGLSYEDPCAGGRIFTLAFQSGGSSIPLSVSLTSI
ncbi:iron ABC transporter substrate-binding protein, partial [Hungatella sp. SL.1.14]|nr:iron ABC transporter substrate-binding protein [Hungatella sp. SL.1.14]